MLNPSFRADSTPQTRFILAAGAATLLAGLGGAASAQVAADGKIATAIARVVGTERTVAAKLSDGSLIHGRIVSASPDSVVIESAAGRLSIARASISDVRDAGAPRTRADGTVEYWFPDANTTRLYFAPTGRTLKQGEGYFASYYVAFASLTVGLTDRLTIGGGTLIVPNSDFWFVTPKIGVVRSENTNVAIGALIMKAGESEAAGISYAVSTFGPPGKSVTLGLGYGFSGSDVADHPVVMAGAERRFANRAAFVTENYIIAGEPPLISYGLRFMGEKLSVDLALINLFGEDAMFPGIPFVDFVVKF